MQANQRLHRLRQQVCRAGVCMVTKLPTMTTETHHLGNKVVHGVLCQTQEKQSSKSKSIQVDTYRSMHSVKQTIVPSVLAHHMIGSLSGAWPLHTEEANIIQYLLPVILLGYSKSCNNCG